MIPVYPESHVDYKTVVNDLGIPEYVGLATTWLRKKHTDGKWYKILIISKSSTRDVVDCQRELWNSFNYQVYSAQKFMKIVPEASIGFELDENQIDEKERLRNAYFINEHRKSK
jgi:hypothetical protein